MYTENTIQTYIGATCHNMFNGLILYDQNDLKVYGLVGVN